MQNIQDDKRNTWFLDVDGTLVVHNYNPEEQEDVFLPGAVDFLKNTSESSVVILTTSRTENHMSGVMKKLSDLGIRIDGLICNLPTGIRYIVNDSKPDTEGNIQKKAVAYALERNLGWT